MRLGGALNGVELNPEHQTYKSIMTAFRVDDTLIQFENTYCKFQKFEYGQINVDKLFVSYRDYTIALLFSADGFLQPTVQKLLSLRTLKLTEEAINKRITLETFFIAPLRRGRKKDLNQYTMLSAVSRKVKSGMSHNAAYESVANEFGKKKDTIRRAWEKFNVKCNKK
jgi:hypothetical protein